MSDYRVDAPRADDSWPEPTVSLVSGLGCSLRLPMGSMFIDDPSSGPGTDQISLPGDILIAIIPEKRVQHLSQVIEWSENQAQRFVDQRAGALIAQGTVSSPGREVYVCAVGFMGLSGDPRIVASVGVMDARGRFMGLLILWPVTDPALEPDLALVRRVIGSLEIGVLAPR
ncbi:MAG TPA: hypothetical protein VIU11_16510 [Nakamurella sp.]